VKKKTDEIVCQKCAFSIATLFERNGKVEFVVHKEVAFKMVHKPTYLFSILCPRCGDRQERTLAFLARLAS
jgi:DNA-directed RNA polymerase subunit RPC12/RpoP